MAESRKDTRRRSAHTDFLMEPHGAGLGQVSAGTPPGPGRALRPMNGQTPVVKS